MTTVTVSDKFTEILASFGDLQESVNAAVQRYTIEQITTKINELRRKDETYQKKYGSDYSAFAKRTSEDEAFVENVEANISKTWEADLADWEFCHKGVEDWTRKLQDILLK
jgi:lipase chaperone LimK